MGKTVLQNFLLEVIQRNDRNLMMTNLILIFHNLEAKQRQDDHNVPLWPLIQEVMALYSLQLSNLG